ncbi:hypothetical protein FAGAP_2136 [Fusarium agapanthi]|uniref:Uncharacterized protein n=1 Tax=Fusarium agapanthi TaxID=1803897 RepID=A0A9P5BG80_9HYPO|nr:hypothetical protein FAGAP_2136 [Fusarium agapanthi]
MEEHHVYHHHHHHYHYHYNYPFPPGLPPNVPQNNEPLNQEVADRENGEPPAENEEEEEEKHSERGDPADQQTSENLSPSPVQQGQSGAITMVKRAGAVVFDDCLDVLNTDALSLRAQARFTITNTQYNAKDHQEGPSRKKARTSSYPERPKSQMESQHHSAHPQQSDSMTVIEKARIVDTDRYFRVINCDSAGPQVNICWRVPGQRNIWLLRISMHSLDYTYKSFVPLFEAGAQPDLPKMSLFMKFDDEDAVSVVVSSCGHRGPERLERLERGEGEILPRGRGDIAALGRLVGFEVLQD